MVQIRAPLDVPHVTPQNQYRTTSVADATPVYAAQREFSDTVKKLLDDARDQQIDNDVRQGELNLRTRLDALRTEVEKDPNYQTMPERWTDGAQEIDRDLSEGMTSPMHQRLWRARADVMLQHEGGVINERTAIRGVEQARAGVITNVGAARRIMIDPNATPEARLTAQRSAETALAEAALRRVLAVDDAARELEGLRNTAAEFSRTEGIRAQSQSEEDRIWAESGGDYGAAMALARGIENPLVRDNVEDRISQRHAREEAAATETLESAMERAYSAIEEGGTVESLSAADQRVIRAAGNMETLRDYIRARANPASTAAVTASSTVVRDTILGAAADRARAADIAGIDLNQPLTAEGAEALGYPEGTRLRDVMTPGHFNEIQNRQRQMRGEESSDGSPNDLVDNTFNNRLLPRARQLAAMAGVNVQPNNGNSTDAQQVRQQRSLFEGYLMGELRAHIQAYGSPPDAAQVDAIARSALTRSTGGGFLGMGRSSRYRFQASPEAPVNVPYGGVPEAQRVRLLRAWARAGNTEPPSEEQIAQMYSEEIAGQAYDGN